MALGASLRSSRIAELVICGAAYLGMPGAPLLNIAVAPGWTATVHFAGLPIAAIILFVGWPRLQAKSA
jgi:hypothetical protein